MLISLVYFSGPLFFKLLLTAVAAVALLEFFRMALPGASTRLLGLAVAWGSALTLLLSLGNARLAVLAMGLTLLFWACWFLLSGRGQHQSIMHLALTLLGLLYVSLPLAHAGLLHGLSLGREWIFLVLLVVMASDTAAYFVGVNIGCRKLYPAVSPNKSVEGALGGLIGSILAALLAKLWFLPLLSLWECLLLGLVLGPLAQLGDLFESLLKRTFGVKDSGVLFPGHGGILDRLDSLMFVFPPTFYFAMLKLGG